MGLVALDVDLHKIYCVAEDKTVLAKAEPDIRSVPPRIYDKLDGKEDTILMEIASPVMYLSDTKAIHNVVKWALWNMSVACWLGWAYQDTKRVRFLVAPSHVWTKGHALKLRHEVAGCKLPQKDLRECEAMMFYYKADPKAWVPLNTYLENL